MLMPFVNLKIDFLKSYFIFVGFLAKYVQKQPLDECIRCGNYTASYIIQQSGITPNDKTNYRNFACIRRTFLHTFLPIIRGCVLYTELENQGVLHQVPRPHGDWKSMTRHYRTPYQNKPLVCFHFNCVSNMLSPSQLHWYR